MTLEMFRCDRCGRIYDRTEFTKGITNCVKCNGRRFGKAGNISVSDILVYAVRNPSKIKQIIKRDING